MKKNIFWGLSRTCGFTLAEVLITLGIIGILAAMTLPTLIQHHRKRVVETSLSRFYSNMQNAIKLSEVENGDKLYWDEMGNSCQIKDEDAENPECVKGSETALVWWNKYMAKYIKTTNIATTINSTNKHSAIIVKFVDGSIIALCSDGINYYLNGKSYEKRDNITPTFGVTAFPFYWNNKKGLIPHPYTLGSCIQGKNGADCTRIIIENGWKIPDDYPFKF